MYDSYILESQRLMFFVPCFASGCACLLLFFATFTSCKIPCGDLEAGIQTGANSKVGLFQPGGRGWRVEWRRKDQGFCFGWLQEAEGEEPEEGRDSQDTGVEAGFLVHLEKNG